MRVFYPETEINIETLRSDIDNVFNMVVSEEELIALAERFEWVSIDRLTVKLSVWRVSFDSWQVKGNIKARIIQNCIVTNEHVPENIDFHVEERYVRFSDSTEPTDFSLDDAEPLKNGMIDIGELALQSLGLAASSWPRIENAPYCYTVGVQGANNPFAGLSSLNRQNRK